MSIALLLSESVDCRQADPEADQGRTEEGRKMFELVFIALVYALYGGRAGW